MLSSVTSSAYAICREARRKAGISTVARIERGRMEPTFDLLTRLVDACDQELRIRITDIDWAGRSDQDQLTFEQRLLELQRFTAFELALNT